MNERIEKWLFDIRIAIDEIDSYFEKGEKSFSFFQRNRQLKRAIERCLEIIGEAVNRILTKDPNIPIANARKIVDLRNFIIHSYDNVSDENIWSIVIKNLPELKKEIDAIIPKEQ